MEDDMGRKGLKFVFMGQNCDSVGLLVLPFSGGLVGMRANAWHSHGMNSITFSKEM